MKDVELKLIVELMKNSRRSDRELAKALKVSQPTISRTIRKLEKEGLIREYTAIPDFYGLGFDLMSVNFVKFKPNTTLVDIEKMKKTANEFESQSGIPSILVMNGMGLDSDRILHNVPQKLLLILKTRRHNEKQSPRKRWKIREFPSRLAGQDALPAPDYDSAGKIPVPHGKGRQAKNLNESSSFGYTNNCRKGSCNGARSLKT